MPRISDFYNIVIWMYWNDHEPPHFHAEYKEHEVLIEIEPLFEEQYVIYAGSLPSRALGLVKEWAFLHKTELRDNWETYRRGKPPLPIQPLD